VSNDIELFTTCPPSSAYEAGDYVRQVRSVSRWSDEAGCQGILVYTDNSLLDPWAVSQIVLAETASLMPLVAVQPVYMHPYAVAKMVATLTRLYRRRICLNLVAGGFKNDLAALGDATPHDKRYERLIEYTSIAQKLLAGGPPVTFEGEFYSVERLALTPAVPPEFYPLFTISGSSEAGLAAARALGALPVKYPEPPGACIAPPDLNGRAGIRVGIVARQDPEEAWRIAERRFPPDRAGQVTHRLAMKTSDSAWHKTLSGIGEEMGEGRSTYWLVPFQNYKTFCPYLVGGYSQVAGELRRYLDAGYRTFLLDIPAKEEDLRHIRIAFQQAVQASGAAAG
jgi:alkanesulfonate monooxygenase